MCSIMYYQDTILGTEGAVTCRSTDNMWEWEEGTGQLVRCCRGTPKVSTRGEPAGGTAGEWFQRRERAWEVKTGRLAGACWP